MGVSVTLMLAVTVFMLLVTQMIPESSTHVAVVGVYFLFCLVLIALVIVSLCMISRLYNRSKIDPPMGRWTRKYVFGKLSYIVGARYDHSRSKEACNGNCNSMDTIVMNIDMRGSTATAMNEIMNGNKYGDSYTLEEEWAIVGRTADYCLFVLFIVVFIIGTICCFA